MLSQMQGVLVYRGNRLIRRLECQLGSDDADLSSMLNEIR